MSLRRALLQLSDDRDTVTAARAVIAYFDRHQREPIDPQRIGSAIGVAQSRVETILRVLTAALVVDCDGDPLVDRCTYVPDAVLNLEVRRFLTASGGVGAGLQRRVDRFRGTYGR